MGERNGLGAPRLLRRVVSSPTSLLYLASRVPIRSAVPYCTATQVCFLRPAQCFGQIAPKALPSRSWSVSAVYASPVKPG